MHNYVLYDKVLKRIVIMQDTITLDILESRYLH